jgi:dihydroxyacid dehydratase/phosphogluconate dehydratase
MAWAHRDILTIEAASGERYRCRHGSRGSTNIVLHLLAIANE